MEININEKFLIENNLSPNQLLILTYIKENKRRVLKKIGTKLSEDPFIVDFDKLRQKEYVEGELYTTSVLTEKAEEIFNGQNLFNELLNAFPTSVIRTDGSKDYLRTDKKKAERLYKKITRGRKDIHEHILKCLEYEIASRMQQNKMMWMKKLPNWLSSNEWETWGEKMKDDDIEALFGKEDEYGTEVE